MVLDFEKVIDLTSYPDNTNPKIVGQLSIIHGIDEGDLTQYYIDIAKHSEGDKSSNAIGIRESSNNTTYYTYTDYDELNWSSPGALITQRRIDRLGLKAFPGVGAIAHYKLAYQNKSVIIAPVKNKKQRTKAPQLSATINPDNSILFQISYQPVTGEDDITYQCFRIILELDIHRLEYITYEQEVLIPQVLVSGTYICYAIGYVNEGEMCSEDSNIITLELTGTLNEWPTVTPGAESPRTLTELLDVTITEPMYHQLLRYNSRGAHWENYTSMDPSAPESAAHILNIVLLDAKNFIVETDNLLNNSVSVSSVSVMQGSSSLTVSNAIVIDTTHLQVVLSSGISASFDVTLLANAFRNAQNDAGPYHCNVAWLDLISYADSTQDMTAVQVSSDDGSATFSVPTSFQWNFNYAALTSIIINGNSWLGLNSSSENIKVNRRDNYIDKYWYRVFNIASNKVLKLRWEGWAPYHSKTDAYRIVWELFLIDNGDAYLHLVSIGNSAAWNGAFTFNNLSYQLDNNNLNVTFKRIKGASGTQASDWISENDSYKIPYIA